MDDFEKELKTGFLEEAIQLLSEVEQCFLTLESAPNDPSILEKIFRLAHNLKGSSKAVGFDELGLFTHEFETFLLKLKSGKIAIRPEIVSLLLRCNDHIKSIVEALKDDFDAKVDCRSLVDELLSQEGDQAAASAPPESEANTPSSEEVRLLNAVLSQSPSEAPPEVNLAEAATEPPAHATTPVAAAPVPTSPSATSNPATADESIRVSVFRLEKLLNYVGEMVILQTVLNQQANSTNPTLLKRTVHQLGKVTKEVQDLSMSLRMVPLKQTFLKMQRIVRDTAGLLGKTIQLQLEGEETEVDKTVLENLSDPLVHLIRNAADHGVETGEERIAKGKTEAGTIKLRAYHQGGKLVIEVRDDGAGIDGRRLEKKAVEKGILKPGAPLSDRDAIHLIFHPGFTTKAQVTEVSGRGVGMDVVKTNIEKLQGEVLVETELGIGTTFKVILPLTLAIIDGMIVKSGEERFVIPLSHVHESVKLGTCDLQKTTGIGEILMLRGENLPSYRLSQLLGKRKREEEEREKIAIVIRTQQQPFVAVVDDILGQHQVVVKKLGNEIQYIKGFSGSAILGDGKPALILELGELISPWRKTA